MYVDHEDVSYYLTVGNENYVQPPMPEGEGVREGIVRGMYRFRRAGADDATRVHLLGSGAILNEAVKAQQILADQYNVAADVWSVTSYQELYRDGHACDRWNLLHPTETPRVPYVTQCLKDAQGPIVAASDYLKVLPDSIDRWTPRRVRSLGTDGYGRSDDRVGLREFFEVNAQFITLATLSELAADGKIERSVIAKAIKEFGIDPEKAIPARS
jgi:pyruvate dehydrogenase E1 component